MEGIKTVIEVGWNLLKDEIIPAAMEGIKTVIEVGWNLLKDEIIPAAMDGIKTIVETGWNVLKNDVIPAAMDGIKNIVTTGFDAMLKAVQALPEKFKAAGQAIVNALKDGIANAWDGLVSWFDGKLGDLTSKLPFSPPKDRSSPLAKLPQAGRSIVKTLLDSMQAEAPKLELAFNQMLAPMGAAADQGGAAGGGTAFNITAVYRQFQSEMSLRDDVRMLQKMSGGG